MSSIADEISKLHEMYQQDILTLEEFKEAKAAALAKHKTQPPAAPAPAPAPVVSEDVKANTTVVVPVTSTSTTAGGATAGGGGVSQQEATHAQNQAATVFLEPDMTGFEDAAGGLHLNAYTHLRTILGNILTEPGNIKFRKLRTQNPTLQKELFVSPGVRPLLLSLGFRLVDTDQPAQVAQLTAFEPDTGAVINANEGEVYVFPMSAPMQPSKFESVVNRLSSLKERDEAEIQTSRQYDQQRKSLGMTVRRSLWVEALKNKEIDNHVATEVLRNPLLEAQEMIVVFKRILTTVIQNPEDKTARQLASSDAAIRAFIAAFGSLEFLCAVVGFQYEESGLSLPFDRDGAFLSELMGPEGALTRLEEKVKERVKIQEDIDRQLAQEEAIKQKRGIQMEEERLGAARRRPTSAASSSSTTTGGKKIPISEALKYLMGGNRVEEEKVAHLQSSGTTPDQTGYDIRSLTHEAKRSKQGRDPEQPDS